jgi:GTPase-associated protein 1, N-terminal domain type 2/GTPase-associated protein 1, middle domain
VTVRQLYYTSCEHGRDGIYGFQVNAATPGLPKALEDAAVSASSYEPSAELLGRTPEPEPAEHPVALGYQRVGEGVVVHRSVYAGRDFTGRRGNYFAHALTLDHPRELAGLLPVDLWHSGVWAEHPVDHPALPELAALPPGSGVGADEVRRLVAREPDRFEVLLSAVQVALAADHGRVVARTSGDDSAALWVAAVTRSLPPAAALDATFTTWTARPDETDVVLACTTPEVRVGGYTATVVDLTADAADADRSRSAYATLLTAVWPHGQAGIDRLHELAATVRPPLAAADLDDFAAAVRILGPTPGDDLTDPELLGALRFVAARMPARAAAATGAWQQVRARLGRPQVDLALIATVLRDAPPSAVPAEVLSDYAAAYTRAFLHDGAAPADSWWPAMPPDQVMDVTRRFVLPALLGEGRPDAVPEARIELFCDTVTADVLRAIARLLDDYPPVHDRELVSRLPLTLSRRLSGVVSTGSHVHRLVLTVRARHGDLDRVDALRELVPAVRRRREDLRTLGVLWDGAVPVEDAVRLLDAFEPADLAAMDLPAAILGTLTQDAARGELGANHARVALALRQDHWGEVPRTTEPVLEAITRGVAFSERPDTVREDDALAALRFVGGRSPLTSAAQEWLTEQVVRWTLQLPPAGHYRVVKAIAPTVDRSVLARYTDRATTFARAAGADEVARLAAVWLAVPDDRWHNLLIHQVLPSVLAKRRRDVERIAKIFARRPADLVLLLAECGGPASAWEKAWDSWRDRYERPSRAQRLAAALPWGRKD